jgi:hypothetical protein
MGYSVAKRLVHGPRSLEVYAIALWANCQSAFCIALGRRQLVEEYRGGKLVIGGSRLATRQYPRAISMCSSRSVWKGNCVADALIVARSNNHFK